MATMRVRGEGAVMLETVEHDPIDVKESSDAFYEIIDNWDRNELLFSKGYRILFLNNQNKLIKKVKSDSADISDLIVDICSIAKDVDSSKIIIGENSLYGTLGPNESMKKKNEKIRFMALDNGISILDQLIVTKNSFYSFARNQY
eukprot:Unigene16369_Nuclearia_a/m.48510 Unigene16369_Nuclearia_a/g.48510  ORF Unigene16369_Nuclearia_a/g.48510 Unigene16369_Nuclearia_a/m.48510 type:complete len:145 (-) Unigene16369_Nuclearia_a:42-476(-)